MVNRIKLALLAIALLTAAIAGPSHAASGRSIVLVIDASGSMKARLPDGITRMDAAKAAVAKFVATLPADDRLALRAYGHQSPTAQKNCKDTALLVPFGDGESSKAAATGSVQGLQPLGYTPIAYSLTLAAADIAGEEAASHVVVLVSDGKETCGGDPCVTAKALADADAKLIVHTVGIDVDAATRGQLQCIANNARGTYIDSASAAELAKAVTTAAATEATPQPAAKVQQRVLTLKLGKLKMAVAGIFNSHEVLDSKGQEAGELTDYQTSVALSPGLYSVKFDNGLWSGIEIKPGETTEISPAFLKVDPFGNDFDDVDILDPETGEVVKQLIRSVRETTLMPGRIDLRFGDVLWPGGVELTAGKTTTVRPGVVKIQTSVSFNFVVKSASGQKVREGSTITASAFALPPGQYVLEIDPDHAIPGIADDQRKLDIQLIEGQELVIDLG